MISVQAAVTIIERDVMMNDHTVLVDEAWQSLKAAVATPSASDNTSVMPCCPLLERITDDHYHCKHNLIDVTRTGTARA